MRIYWCLRCSTVLVSQRGNVEGFEEADGDPPRDVVGRRKALATARPRGRRDAEARRRAKIAATAEAAAGAWNKLLFPAGKKVEE